MRTFREFLLEMDAGAMQPNQVDPISNLAKYVRGIPDAEFHIRNFMSGKQVPPDVLQKIDQGLGYFADNMPAGAARTDHPGSLLKWVVQNYGQASGNKNTSVAQDQQGAQGFQQQGGGFQSMPQGQVAQQPSQMQPQAQVPPRAINSPLKNKVWTPPGWKG